MDFGTRMLDIVVCRDYQWGPFIHSHTTKHHISCCSGVQATPPSPKLKYLYGRACLPGDILHAMGEDAEHQANCIMDQHKKLIAAHLHQTGPTSHGTHSLKPFKAQNPKPSTPKHRSTRQLGLMLGESPENKDINILGVVLWPLLGIPMYGSYGIPLPSGGKHSSYHQDIANDRALCNLSYA